MIAITSIQRDRAPYIVEWLAFHMVVGFDRFFVYSHLSQDGMDHMLFKLATRYPITPFRVEDIERPQLAVYQHSWASHGANVDWMAFIDGDEFLFPTQDATMAEALARFAGRDLSALAAYWKCYGSNGHVTEPGGLMVEKFPRHSAQDFAPNRHVKSILKGGETADFVGSHVFATAKGTFDERMRPITGGWTDHEPSYDVLRINHYACQSWEFFKKQKQHSGAPDVNPLLVRPDGWFLAHDRNECDDGTSYNFLLRLKLKVMELEAFLREA